MGEQVEESSETPSSRPLATCCVVTFILMMAISGLSAGYLVVELGLFHPKSGFFQGFYLGTVLQVSGVTRQRQNINHFPLFLALVVWLEISELLGLIPATPDSDIWTYFEESIVHFSVNDVSVMMQNGKVFIVLMGVAVIFFMPFRKIPTFSDNPEPPTTTTANSWKGIVTWALKPFFAVFVIGYFAAGFLTNYAAFQGYITGQCMVFVVHLITGQDSKLFAVFEAFLAWLAISELIGLIPLISDMRAYLQDAEFSALVPDSFVSSMMQNGNGKGLIFLIGVAAILFQAFRKIPTPIISGNPSTKLTDTEEGIQEKSESLDDGVVIRSVEH